MLMKNSTFLLATVACIGLIGCQQTEPPTNPQPSPSSQQPLPLPEIQQPADFSYTTSQNVMLQINAKAAGVAAQGVPFTVYQNKKAVDMGNFVQEVGDKEVLRGLTDASGQYQQRFMMPADLTKAYLRVNYLGLTSELIELPIQQNTLRLELDDQKVNLLRTAAQIAKNNLKPQLLPVGTVLNYLATYSTGSNGGVPSNFSTDQSISSATLQTINASLPEGIALPNNPKLKNYIARGAASNLVLNQSGQVWMTFIHEGAGYKNSVGYYLYDSTNPPRTVNDIKTRMVIAYPNASFTNSGGGLSTGKRIQLRHYDPSQPAGQQWSDTFPAGTGIGWFLVANGWNSTGVVERSTQQTVFSDQAINYQLYQNNAAMVVEKSAQTVLLDNGIDAEGRKSLLLGFEDILRYQGGDQDFNDAVLLIQANPPSAVASSVLVRDPQNTDVIRNVALLPVNNPQTADSDGDGVNDSFDDYPDDPSKALNSYLPAKNDYGTLMFEDLWPKKGDYDFNDMVVDYNVIQVTNANNQLVQIIGEYTVKALGGGFHNGFAFQTKLLPSQVASVAYAWEKNGLPQTGTPPRYGAISYASNGLEAGHSKATVVVFEDGYDITPPSIAERPFYSNVVDTEPIKTPGKVRVTITLTAPVALSSIENVPYNPFIIVNSVSFENSQFIVSRTRGTEVHLPGFAPTVKADPSLFGTQDDTSNASSGRYYIDQSNRPWGLNLPTRLSHLHEKLNENYGWVSLGEDIRNAYLKFDLWADSGGGQYKDWYRDLPNYRNIAKIYAGVLP
jgi:LruC domain-containing protein